MTMFDTDLVSYKEPNPLIFYQPPVVVSLSVLIHILPIYLNTRMFDNQYWSLAAIEGFCTFVIADSYKIPNSFADTAKATARFYPQ